MEVIVFLFLAGSVLLCAGPIALVGVGVIAFVRLVARFVAGLPIEPQGGRGNTLTLLEAAISSGDSDGGGAWGNDDSDDDGDGDDGGDGGDGGD